MNLKRHSGIFRRNAYVYLAFFGAAMLMLLDFFVNEAVPFGGLTMLRMDLYHQYGPLFGELADRLRSGSSLLYSWTSGGGSSFLGNYYNYLSSPICWIVLLFSRSNVTDAISVFMLLKAAFAAGFFAYYLKKTFGRNDFVTSTFGVLYAFCGFFIAYYWNVMWIDAMAIFPLVILGIERIIKNGKFALYSVALAVTLYSNYYMGYMVCIFSVVYFIVYFCANYSMGSVFTRRKVLLGGVPAPKSAKPLIKKKLEKINPLFNLRFINSGFRFAFASLLAVCLVAFSLIPVYFILKACSATSGTFPAEMKLYFSIFDFIANHFSSVDPTIRSSGDDVLPNVFCGLITLMLVPLFMFCKEFKIKEKVAYTALLGIMFLSFNINYLNYIWHGFHFPNDLPYRQSFMYSFILLVIAYRVIDKVKAFKKKELLTAGFMLVVFIILAEKIGSKNVQDITIYLSVIFAVVYTLILAMMTDEKNYQASAVAMLLFCCVIAEAAIGNTIRIPASQLKADYAGDYSEFQVIKKRLDEAEEGKGIYRMELTELRTRMDNSWYGYNGVSVFSSMAYEKLSNLQSHLGLFGNFINSYTYKLQTPIYNSMMSLKYIVDNSDYSSPDSALYTRLLDGDTFTAYSNNYWLPIAYCVSNNIMTWDHTAKDPFYVQNSYAYKATGVPEIMNRLEFDHFEYDNINEFTDGLTNGELVFFRTVNDAQANFSAFFDVTATQNYYLYVSSSNVTEISINTGGVINTYNTDEKHVIDVGIINQGDTFCVNIPINEGNSGYIDLYAYGLDMDKFTEYYDILNSQAFVTDTFDETYISGTVNAPEDCVLYTSIPSDPGWTVKIDGAKVPEEEILAVGDALIGVSLAQGEHRVEFSFSPKGLKEGIIISCCAVLLSLGMIFFLRKKKHDYSPDEAVVSVELADLIDESDAALGFTPYYPPADSETSVDFDDNGNVLNTDEEIPAEQELNGDEGEGFVIEEPRDEAED